MYMMNNYEKVTIDLAPETVRKWKETYQWIPIFGAFATISTLFLAGANNLSSPFSTPLGSGALTLVKAFITACLIYFPGVAFTTNITGVNNGLFSDFLEARQPDAGFLMWSLVIVLITAAIWLGVATYLELPVSAEQSIQGALLGTIVVTQHFNYIPIWNKNEKQINSKLGGLIWVLLEWTVAPLFACFCGFLVFTVLRASVLRHENAEKRILIFLPIIYGLSAGLLCLFVVYQVIPNLVPINKWVPVAVSVATLTGVILSLVVVVPMVNRKIKKSKRHKIKENENKSTKRDQSRDIDTNGESGGKANSEFEFETALKEYMEMRVLETVHEEDEKSLPNTPDTDQVHSDNNADHSLEVKSSITDHSAPLKQLLQSTPNRLVQTTNLPHIKTKNSSEFVRDTLCPAIEYDKGTLIRHALAEKYDEIEEFFSFPHILASCIFALIQSASEIAPLVTPYGAIKEIFSNRQVYSYTGQYSEWTNVTCWWVRAIGGLIAVVGFFLCGRRLTQCLGGKLTYVSNSRGLTSQMSTVIAMIAVSKLKLPASSVHAFVGSLVGVGIADDPKNVNWKLVLKVVCGWVMTLVFCCGFAFVLFSASLRSPAYVVP